MICSICGSFFVEKRKNTTTCSHTCSKEQNKRKQKEWYKANKNRLIEARKVYYEQNKMQCRVKQKKYQKANRARYNAYNAVRKKGLALAFPVWANLDELEDVYLEAKYFDMEVDHIIPIKHPLVCGLHVRNNLQLLTSLENKQKSNNYTIGV